MRPILTLLVMISLVGTALAQETGKKIKPWKVSGDIRLRSEFDTNRSGDKPDRERGRIRLRLKAAGDLNEQLNAGIQLRSGAQDNIISANYSFYNNLPEVEYFGVILDQLYLTIKTSDNTSLTLGKSPYQFSTKSPTGKLVWDTDYSPVGLVFEQADKNFNLRVGGYVLERVGNPIAVIVETEHKLTENLTLDMYVADISNINDGAFQFNHGNQGQDINGDGKDDQFRSKFLIISPTLTYKTKLGDIPTEINAQYIKNVQAYSRGDGFAVGFQLGRNKEAGDISGFYRYQQIGQDAVFTPVSQDDTPVSSNFSGHVAGVRYSIERDLQLDCWVLTAKPLTTSGPQQVRFRVDLGWKF